MGLEHTLALLNPTRVNLDGAGRGLDALTADLVAAALGSARDPAGVNLLIADLVDRSGYQDLEDELHGRLMNVALRQGWMVKQPRTLHGLTKSMLRLALYEALMPPKCPRCRGRLQRYSRAVRRDVPCERCEGCGSIALTSRERARQMAMNHEAWRTIWAPRYQSILGWLDNLAGTAAAEVRRALK